MLLRAPPSRESRAYIDVIDDFVRRFLAAAYYISSGEPKDRNLRALKYAVASPIIARLIDGPLMELMTVALDSNDWAMFVKTRNKNS